MESFSPAIAKLPLTFEPISSTEEPAPITNPATSPLMVMDSANAKTFPDTEPSMVIRCPVATRSPFIAPLMMTVSDATNRVSLIVSVSLTVTTLLSWRNSSALAGLGAVADTPTTRAKPIVNAS